MMAWAGDGSQVFPAAAASLFGLLGDLVHGAEPHLIGDSEWWHRHARGLGRVFNQGRSDTLHQEVVPLGNEGPEHAARVEAGAVVDDDGRLLDLQDVVPGLGQRLLGGLLAYDDFDHLHSLYRREEMESDEFRGTTGGLRQVRDG